MPRLRSRVRDSFPAPSFSDLADTVGPKPIWRDSKVVMQRPAKPCTPVRFRLPPPKYQSECKPQAVNSRCGIGLNKPYINQHGGVAECLCCVGCNPRIGRLKSAPPPPIIQAEKPQPGPSGGIGRHNGLKIRRSLIRAYRFDSGLGHHKPLYSVLFLSPDILRNTQSSLKSINCLILVLLTLSSEKFRRLPQIT